MRLITPVSDETVSQREVAFPEPGMEALYELEFKA